MPALPHRRQVLQGLAAAGAAALLPWRARAQVQGERFLIVITGTGGASIIDAMLAVRASESRDAAAVNAYPDGMVQSIGAFRAIDQRLNALGPLPYQGPVNQSDFVRRHAQDMMVVTHTGTSVNHLVAQKRAITGNDAWAGRTLQEVVAATYGQGVPLPNVNMGVGGYIEPGIDPELPTRARAEPVVDATLWALGLDGQKGIENAPPRRALELTRSLRDRLDGRTEFGRTFGASPALQRWLQRRAEAPGLEDAGLMEKLLYLPDTPQSPLAALGLTTGPDAERVRAAFPLYLSDPLEAQAALAYLLIVNRVSVSVTLGPGLSPNVGGQQIVDSPPLAFDFSHSAHRGTQALMWSRLLSVADRLIGLLQEAEYADGQSFWDRSLVYFASDFGRSRRRPEGASEFGSGHHLNNGSLIVSPMANGGQVLGGVDPDTTLTYGFDPATGRPEPGREMAEAEIFAGILQALGVSTAGTGLRDMRAMRRA
jgi:hypothetical protein